MLKEDSNIDQQNIQLLKRKIDEQKSDIETLIKENSKLSTALDSITERSRQNKAEYERELSHSAKTAKEQLQNSMVSSQRQREIDAQARSDLEMQV